MIGDDEVDASSPRALCRGKSPGTRIDADDQTNAGDRGPFYHIPAQIVTFANPVRHVEVGGSAAQFDRGFQDHDRGRAIDVVIAINQNSLFSFNSSFEPFHGCFHSGHQ